MYKTWKLCTFLKADFKLCTAHCTQSCLLWCRESCDLRGTWASGMENGHYSLLFSYFLHKEENRKRKRKKGKRGKGKGKKENKKAAFLVFSSIIVLCVPLQEGNSHISHFLLGCSNFIFLPLGSSNKSISVCRLTQAELKIIYTYILAHINPDYGYR